MKRKLVSEQTVMEAAKRGEKSIPVGADALVTDAARERAKQLGIRLESKKVETPQTAPALPLKPRGDSAEVLAIGTHDVDFLVTVAV